MSRFVICCNRLLDYSVCLVDFKLVCNVLRIVSVLGSDGKEDGEDCQEDDLSDADADEDESDLDMAWKMLDIARAITDKHSTDTMEKVDILCALAEISLERGSISFSNHLSNVPFSH